eukprot:4436545-Lingulodinium_polyedra.AAC.1
MSFAAVRRRTVFSKRQPRRATKPGPRTRPELGWSGKPAQQRSDRRGPTKGSPSATPQSTPQQSPCQPWRHEGH